MGITVAVRSRVPQVTTLMRERAALVVEKVARDIERDAKLAAPIDTGLLKNSIKAAPVTELHWEVHSPVNYSAVMEYGSAPHIIRARNKKALFWAGAKHPVAEVHHPGTKARPYMTPAAERHAPTFREAMRRIFR